MKSSVENHRINRDLVKTYTRGRMNTIDINDILERIWQDNPETFHHDIEDILSKVDYSHDFDPSARYTWEYVCKLVLRLGEYGQMTRSSKSLAGLHRLQVLLR